MARELARVNQRLAMLAEQVPLTWERDVRELIKRKEELESAMSRHWARTRANQTPAEWNVKRILTAVPEDTVLVDMLEFQTPRERHVAAFVVRGGSVVAFVDLGPVAPIAEAVQSWRKAASADDRASTNEAGNLLRRLVWQPLQPHLGESQTVLVSPDGVISRFPFTVLPGTKRGTYLIEERAIAILPTYGAILSGREHDSPPGGGLLLVGDVDFGRYEKSWTIKFEKGSISSQTINNQAAPFGPLPGAGREIRAIESVFRRTHPNDDVQSLSGVKATKRVFRTRAPGQRYVHLATHGFFMPPQEAVFLLGLAKSSRRWIADADAGANGFGGWGIPPSRPGVARAMPTQGGLLGFGPPKSQLQDLIGRIDAIENRYRPSVLGMFERRNPSFSAIDWGQFGLSDQWRGDSPAEIYPGLLSGIVLAGANQRFIFSGAEVDPENNGILTAMELVDLQLEDAELVVLSACESGLGEIVQGEGSLGLPRALLIAGAESVVASLWKVDDNATQVLMVEFYKNLWEKKLGKLEALRQAQLTMLRQYDDETGKLRGPGEIKSIGSDKLAASRTPIPDRSRDSDTTLPPLYWAAFMLSGDWR
jgi:CHAT domain-containing protein